MNDPAVTALILKLRERPGRGGVRLSYDEARLALDLIRAGADPRARRELAKRRRRNGLQAGGRG